MRRNNFLSLTTGAILLFSSLLALSQPVEKKEKAAPRDYKNVIKINVSAEIFYNNVFIVNYERILSPHRSFTVFGGYNEFPFPNSIKSNPEIHLLNNKKNSGYQAGIDYRFYLKDENKYDAPHGIYIGPYMSFNSFRRDRILTYTASGANDSLLSRTQINLFSVGAELGYQFVLWRRVTIDAIMFGPAITAYHFNMKIDGNIDPSDRSQVIQDLIDALIAKYPLLADLSSTHTVDRRGIKNFWSVGFRYAVHIGFRF